MMQDFFEGKDSMTKLNWTNITLIPKVDEPELVSQFWPIGLCNFTYKMVSEVLTSRLKPLLSCYISQSQGAFMPQKMIHDNVIIPHEILHYLRNRRTSLRC